MRDWTPCWDAPTKRSTAPSSRVATGWPPARACLRWSAAPASPAGGLELEVHEQPAPVVAVLLDPVVELLDVLLVEEAEDLLLQRSGALTGDDLDERRLLRDGLVDDAAQRPVDVGTLV